MWRSSYFAVLALGRPLFLYSNRQGKGNTPTERTDPWPPTPTSATSSPTCSPLTTTRPMMIALCLVCSITLWMRVMLWRTTCSTLATPLRTMRTGMFAFLIISRRPLGLLLTMRTLWRQSLTTCTACGATRKKASRPFFFSVRVNCG